MSANKMVVISTTMHGVKHYISGCATGMHNLLHPRWTTNPVEAFEFLDQAQAQHTIDKRIAPGCQRQMEVETIDTPVQSPSQQTIF